MNKLKLIAVLLLALCLLTLSAVVSFAEETVDGAGDGEVDPGRDPEDVIPEEQEPAYSITDKGGVTTDYFNQFKITEDFANMDSGSTMTLLTDIYWADRGLQLNVKKGADVCFDFCGHVIKSEVKSVLFVCDGLDTSVSVYSSLPGAAYYGKRPNDTQGGCFIRVSGGAEGYIGDYGDYSGDNLSVYVPVAIDVHGSSFASLKGGNIYKNIQDWPGLFICRGAGTIDVERANIYGIITPANFCMQSSGANITVKDSLIFNLPGVGGNVISTHTNGSQITFSGCAFVNSVMAAGAVNAGADGSEKAKMIFDEGCVWGEQPLSNSTTVDRIYPEGCELARVNRVYERTLRYCIFGFGEVLNYDEIIYNEPIGVTYSYASPDDISDVEWSFLDKYYRDGWVKGETPFPTFKLPQNNHAVKYVIDPVSPVEDYAFYAVTPERNFEIYYNYTLYSSMALNVYLPVYVADSGTIHSVNFAGTSYNKSQLLELPRVTLGGYEYCVITKEGIAYNSALSSFTLTVNALGADINSTVANFSEILTLPEYCKTVLDAASAESFFTTDFQQDKNRLAELVAYICSAYESVGRTPPADFKALISKKD